MLIMDAQVWLTGKLKAVWGGVTCWQLSLGMSQPDIWYIVNCTNVSTFLGQPRRPTARVRCHLQLSFGRCSLQHGLPHSST